MGLVYSLDLAVHYGNSQEFAIKFSILTMLALSFFGISGILCNAAGSIALLSRWVILFQIGCICTEIGAKFTLTYYRIPSFLRGRIVLMIYNSIGSFYNISVGIYCLFKHKKRYDLVGVAGSLSFFLSGVFFSLITVMIVTNNTVEF